MTVHVEHPTYVEDGTDILIGHTVELMPRSYGHTFTVVGIKEPDYLWMETPPPGPTWIRLVGSNGTVRGAEANRLRRIK